MSLFSYLELKREARELREDVSADYVALTRASRTKERRLMTEIDQLQAQIDELKAEIDRLKVHLGIMPPPEPPKKSQAAEWTTQLKPEPPKAPETLPEMLKYAGRFQTDDGMTAYLEKITEALPEEERKVVENLLRRSPAEIRKEIGRIAGAE